MKTLVFVALVASSAAAEPMPPIDTSGTPPPCAALAAVPADATIPRPAVFARISFASCAAMAKMSALQLKADDASVAAVAAAAKPSLDLYQAAIDQNDSALTEVAKAARADLFAAMAVRLRTAIPPITMATVGAPLVAHDEAHAFVESKIGPWLDKARAQ